MASSMKIRIDSGPLYAAGVGLLTGVAMGLYGWPPLGTCAVFLVVGMFICPWVSLIEILCLRGWRGIPKEPAGIVEINIVEWLCFSGAAAWGAWFVSWFA